MSDTCKPYQFHPTRPKKQNGDTDRMEVDVPADQGAAAPRDNTWRLQSMDWCTCGNCTNLHSCKDNICCRELEKVAEMQPGCITHHPDFEATVLRRSVLTVAIRSRHNLRRITQREPFSHDLLRHQGYTQFTMWVHARLGRGVRRVVPACAAHLIHKSYPDASGNYQGFQNDSSDDE